MLTLVSEALFADFEVAGPALGVSSRDLPLPVPSSKGVVA